MMTFEQFRASRQYCGDLTKTIHAAYFENYGRTPIGLVYAGDLFIEIFDGDFVLTIGNTSGRSKDLEAMEHDLYDYAVSEGVI